MRLTVDKQQEFASELLTQCKDIVGEELTHELLHAVQSNETAIQAQRKRVAALKERLQEAESRDA
jgi:pyruvate-ferredoxin/flavodoxin oxidoreductase